MNRFALLSLYRSLTRHKLYAGLNIGGLAIGIAVFLTLGLYVRFETSFETWLPRHEQIYVVETEFHIPGSPFDGASQYTMGGLLDQLKEDFPGVVGTRIEGGSGSGSVVRAGNTTKEDVAQVDPSFFDVFDLPMVNGDGRSGLAQPTGALISETTAHKYFGSTDPVGQSLTVAFNSPITYRIAGVFRDLPKNTDLQFNILIPMPRTNPSPWWNHWGSASVQTYLRFPTSAEAKAFEQKLPAFVDRRGFKDLGRDAHKTVALPLLPVDRAHLQPSGGQSASAQMTVVTLGLVGILTLLIAVVNYINLATARAGLRAREVAMRKVLGADQGVLVRQFLGEAILTVSIAGLVGLILAELGLPIVNAAGGLSLAIPYVIVLPALIALAVVVGLMAGFYPAVLLSRFPAAAVLASARAPGGGRAGARIREALVVFQFGLAIAFMIGTMVLVAQTRHVRHADLGFQREGLIVVSSLADSQITPDLARRIVATFKTIPGAAAVGVADSAAGGGSMNNATSVAIPGIPGSGPTLRSIAIGPGFLDVYGARPIAGRLFDAAHAADDGAHQAKGTAANIVISRKAVATLGFQSPEEAVGKTVGKGKPLTIIGVVEDQRFFSPRVPMDPTMFHYYADPPPSPIVSIRFTGDPRAMIATLRSAWHRMVPQVAFDAGTADERLNAFYEADDQSTRLFAIGAGLAVLIGCVGLWGLASFNTARRVKEIGIRKTLGASSPDIVRLLVGQFLRPVLVANVIGWPLAFIAMRTWLAGFDDRITLSPLYFVGATALATMVALLTVISQSLRASRATPAWAMRHE